MAQINTEEKDENYDDENDRVYKNGEDDVEIGRVYENEDDDDEAIDNDDQNESEYDVCYLPDLEKVVDKLDFSVVPCKSRDGSGEMEIHHKKQADDLLRFQIVDLVHHLQKVTMWSPKKIATVVSTLLCYDHGYEK
eukprot:11887750-Ditylum_brightwellii.AAC.1